MYLIYVSIWETIGIMLCDMLRECASISRICLSASAAVYMLCARVDVCV